MYCRSFVVHIILEISISGQKVMADLETKQANLRDTLLRISGAIQILEEEIGKVNTEQENTQNSTFA
ncbi:hypothetical protein I8751_27695 [Nostocaceae cyanobacterium CENA357]|uniref:Uncharacterized protein n=1 Tax=Atlanticothrix silvestris CENA357 TaxID=1725252 RepID=A0A8J7HMS9_9CYAN|nr:hypothetical protein [Atlanticothrix silvestris CENA357]